MVKSRFNGLSADSKDLNGIHSVFFALGLLFSCCTIRIEETTKVLQIIFASFVCMHIVDIRHRGISSFTGSEKLPYASGETIVSITNWPPSLSVFFKSFICCKGSLGDIEDPY